MSLATRCTSCGTVFRVVQDQLKVSEGWVRCGRCNEVFNALEGLFDLERDTPPEGSVPLGADVAAATAGAIPDTPWNTDGFVVAPDPNLVDKLDTRLFGSRRADSESTPANHVRARDRHEFSDAQFNPEWVADDEVSSQAGALVSPETTDEEGPADNNPAPEFVRRAQREARWRSSRARLALSGVSVLLLACLALQAAHHFRDLVAARWPALKPALLVWCETLTCRIEPPRRIEDISVEHTALARVGTSDSFRLSVTLRSRSAIGLALPSIELSLTDGSGLLIARRALAPRDFRAPSGVLPAGGESPLQLLLATGGPRVSGYTVEIFYP
ncbi:MAG: zinc-ribbon and DUF3426 domain-containing protein [Burkholderiales bacterium]|nr:zinc-ribbon and DUF3426 domain-containing protein [Burkholderiales bacterium]